MAYPNTGTLLDPGRTNSGLSTQIIIKVDNTAVGALQRLSVAQARPLQRIQEIGTDGVTEIVPSGATTLELRADRIVFDQLRLPEAFSRGFRFISAQRLAFDIDVYDVSSVNTPNSDPTDTNAVVMTYKNCWFSSYETPYASDNYLITETATIWAETAFISNMKDKLIPNARNIIPSTDPNGIESAANTGGRRGSMDATGLWYSLFDGTNG